MKENKEATSWETRVMFTQKHRRLCATPSWLWSGFPASDANENLVVCRHVPTSPHGQLL